jgi:two-component system sensor histidine kinase/response regulator
MDSQILNNLFKIGENISRHGTNNENGSGLGLILCKEFIIKHNGKIWAQSIENVGSEFLFVLPNFIDM